MITAAHPSKKGRFSKDCNIGVHIGIFEGRRAKRTTSNTWAVVYRGLYRVPVIRLIKKDTGRFGLHLRWGLKGDHWHPYLGFSGSCSEKLPQLAYTKATRRP